MFHPASEITVAYRRLLASGPLPLTPEMHKVLEEADKPKKGGKQKPKVGPSKPAQTPKKKKVKRAVRRPRTPTLSDVEDSQSNTISGIRIPEQVQQEHDDTAVTSHLMVLEPITTNPEVTFSMPTSVPITDDLFQDFTPPSPTATTTPITIAPYSNVSVGVSQPQISMA